MSRLTNLKAAFKLSRMIMLYGASNRQAKRALSRSKSGSRRLPARQRQWVIRQVRLEIDQPF